MKLIKAVAALALVAVSVDVGAQVTLQNPSNEDAKSEIVRTITKSYVDGRINGDHVADDCKIKFNNHELTKEEWAKLTEFHHQIFENIEFTIGWVQTTKYEGENWDWGDGTTWSHQWNSWTATSKISGETHTNTCHWGFLWENNKIKNIYGFFSDEWYNKEVTLYTNSTHIQSNSGKKDH